MELDITQFVRDESPMDYSASIAEIGQDAGPRTWRAACENASTYVSAWMPDADARDEVIEHFLNYGAWTREELDSMDLAALLLQDIAATMREDGIVSNMGRREWSRVERRAQSGQASGRIFRGNDGRIYFYIGS